MKKIIIIGISIIIFTLMFLFVLNPIGFTAKNSSSQNISSHLHDLDPDKIGVVTINIISRTNITSTKGVTFISERTVLP